GTRMLPLTKTQPKEMLPLGRKPCIQYIVEELAEAGIEQILFITGYKKRAIEDHFDKDNELNKNLSSSGQKDLLKELAFEDLDVSFFYTRQSIQAGLGHAVACAKDFVGDDSFIIALGDSVIYSTERESFLKRMLKEYKSHDPCFVIGTRRVSMDEVHRYGIIDPIENDNGGSLEIKDLIEKPLPSNAPSNLAIAARYIMPSGIFDCLDRTRPGKGGEIQLTDAIRLMLREGMKGYSVNLSKNEKRYDIGNFPSYYEAFLDFALRDEIYGYRLRQYVIERMNL
ncbi:MAG: NTP transferase domain-containing protein, partial [Clostridiales bacterium]|nr:NTP transferase domain-containing protein [Clostridiales bacterium]